MTRVLLNSHGARFCEYQPTGRCIKCERANCTCRALLAAHPRKADILAAELDRAELLASPQRPEPRGMLFSDLASLTYLDGVIQQLDLIMKC